jgi:hypothetical protein
MWTNLATGTAFWAIGRAIAWTAALAILGSSGVSAQTPRDRPDGPPAVSREDAAAFVEARIAALHSGLALTPDQERMWPAFEQAWREMAKLRLESALGAAPPPTDNPIARMQRRADALARQGAALKGLADAAAPLWQSFDDGQKRRFAVLVRPANLRMGFGGRPDERSGPPGREGDRFGRDRRDFGSSGPPDRGGDFGRDRRDFGPSGPPGRGGDYGRDRRDFGPGGPPGRGGEEYGYGRDRRGMGPDGPDRGYGRDYGRDSRRDFGRDSGRDFRRGPLPWWHPDIGPGRGAWRDGRELGDRDFRGRPRGGYGDYDERP